MDQETINILISTGAALLGALIGGATSFFGPLVVENIRYRREQENSKMQSCYIPLCKSIESLLEKMNNYVLLPDNAINFDRIYEYYNSCRRFLNAEHRLLINNGVLKKLKCFCDSFDLFCENLTIDVSNYCTDIEKIISEKMIDNKNDEFCIFNLFDDSSNEIKRMFIVNKFYSYLSNIKSVDVVLKMEIDGEDDYTYTTYNTFVKDELDDSIIELDNSLAEKMIKTIGSLKPIEKALSEKALNNNKLGDDYKQLINKLQSLKQKIYKHLDRYK